jgi:tetratricopeptide (TPR) repeat protein
LAVSNKKRKWILRNYPSLPVAEIARQMGIKEQEVAAVLEEDGVDLSGVQVSGQPRTASRSVPAERGAILIIVLFTGIIFANSLRNDFHYDDIHSLKDNLQIRFLSNIPKYFTHPEMFSSRPNVMMPRPLLLITFALNYAWTQYRPWSWLLVNYGFHIGNAVLVYLALCHLLGRRRGALLAALLFACHPVNTETVNYINCRSSLMADMFMILTAYFFFRSQLESRTGLYAASLVCLAAGLLTKEEAFMTPFLVLALDWLHFFEFSREDWGPRLFKRHLPLFLLLLLYLIYRRLVQGFTLTTAENPPQQILENLMIQSRVLIHYLNLLLIPIHLNSSYENIPYLRWFGDYVILAWIYLGGLMLLAVALRRKAPVVSFFIINFFLTLAPTSSVIRFNAFMNEHRLYLPSLGFCLLLALSLEKLDDLKPRWSLAPAAWRTLVNSLVVFIFVGYTGLAVSRNFLWKSDMNLWRDSAKKSPMKAQVISDLGNAFYRNIPPAQDPGTHPFLDRAEQLYNWAIRADVTYFKAYHNLGTIYYTRANSAERQGQKDKAPGYYQKAVEYFQGALKINSYNAETWNDMGSTLIRLQRLSDAENAYRTAVSMDPHLYKAQINLGVALFYQGNEIEPKNPEAARALFQESVSWLEKSLTVYDRDPTAWFYLSQIYAAKLHQLDKAYPDSKKAVELAPDNEFYRQAMSQIEKALSTPGDHP